MGTEHSSLRESQHPPRRCAQYGPGKSLIYPFTLSEAQSNVNKIPTPNTIFAIRMRLSMLMFCVYQTSVHYQLIRIRCLILFYQFALFGMEFKRKKRKQKKKKIIEKQWIQMNKNVSIKPKFAALLNIYTIKYHNIMNSIRIGRHQASKLNFRWKQNK